MYREPDIYSESETITNKLWIDGKPIYRTVVDMGAGPNVSTKNVAHGITGIDTCISIMISADNGTVSYIVATVTSNERVFRNGTDIAWTTANDRSGYQGYAIVEYTKT